MLGFADPDVSAAVIRRVENGSMCTLNPPEEVELAERLIGIHPWAEQARFARTGGECAAMAVRIARATTGRQMVAVCGYSGWHDWYLAANLGEDDSLCGHLLPGLKPAGVPKNLRNTTVTFRFNNREEFDQVMDQYGDQLACVIMEPVRNELPKDQFLQHDVIRRYICTENRCCILRSEPTIAHIFSELCTAHSVPDTGYLRLKVLELLCRFKY